MAWRTEMREASFRGVPFGVQSAETPAGRTVAVHSFIGRDLPWVEDLGGALKTYNINGFVHGKNYHSKRDALLAALDAPGPGTLVHPYLGEMRVALNGVATCTEGVDIGGGWAVFAMVFVLVEEPGTPSAKINPLSRLDMRIKAAASAIQEKLDGVLKAMGQGSYVLGNAIDDVLAISGHCIAIASGSLPVILNTLGNLTGLDTAGALRILASVNSAKNLYDYIRGVVNPSSSGVSSSYTYLPQSSSQIAAAGGDILAATLPSAGISTGSAIYLGATALSTPKIPENSGAQKKLSAENSVALTIFERETLAIQLAEIYSEAIPESSEEASLMRSQVNDLIDVVLLETDDDAVYAAFTDLKAAAIQAIASNAGQAPTVVEISTQIEQPSSVAVWRYAGSTATDADFILRNAIRHPGFVPAGTLEFLLEQGAA